jgi:hypothetical protein
VPGHWRTNTGKHATLALTAYEGSSWAPTAMYVLNVIGLAHAMSGRLNDSARELEKARTLAQTHHDVRVQGLVHFNLARVWHQLDETEKARAAIAEAAAIFDRVNAGERIAEQPRSARTHLPGSAHRRDREPIGRYRAAAGRRPGRDPSRGDSRVALKRGQRVER